MLLFISSMILILTIYYRNILHMQQKETKCKIVINSHVKYQNPLGILFESLEKNKFSEWNRIIVVLGGDSKESIGKEKMFNHKVTVIRTKDNAFDLHGLNQLYVHRNHGHVTASHYFYMLDTSIVEHGFPKALDSIRPNENEIYTTSLPNSNITLFDRGVVMKYGDSLKGSCTKQKALDFELRGGLHEFGNVRYLKNREETGEEDIYKTGHPRRKFYYPDFEITKFILWEQNGDITGKIQDNW